MPLPAPPPSPPVIRPFAPPVSPYGAGHRGLDLPAAVGQPVRSLSAGDVRFVGMVAGVPVLTVDLGDGRRVTYQPVTSDLAVGAHVDVGTVLGVVPSAEASGGHCADAGCIHIGLRRGAAYLDPSVLLTRRPAVLKPP